jgi:hypothetical protein
MNRRKTWGKTGYSSSCSCLLIFVDIKRVHVEDQEEAEESGELFIWRMPSSGILRRVALVRTDVSEELSASFIRVTRIDEIGTTLAVTANRRTQAAYIVAAY